MLGCFIKNGGTTAVAENTLITWLDVDHAFKAWSDQLDMRPRESSALAGDNPAIADDDLELSLSHCIVAGRTLKRPAHFVTLSRPA
jgi:hypothetical protein